MPLLVVLSSQVMVAESSVAGPAVAASASENVATVPLNGVPAVAVMLARAFVSPALATVAVPLLLAELLAGPLTATLSALAFPHDETYGSRTRCKCRFRPW